MAEEQYAAYNYQFGYTPKQPSHLIAFAKKNGVKVTWGQAKQLIRKAPDTSGYIPPPKKDGQPANKPPQRKNTEEKKSEKIEIAKRYSSANINIDQKQLFNVNRRNTLQKYQYLVTQLTAMGWDQKQSLEALKATNGNLQLAIEMLMSGEINSGPMITLKKMNTEENQLNLRKVPKKNNNNNIAPIQQQQITPQQSSQSQFQSSSQSYSAPQSQQQQQQPQSQPKSQWNNQLQNSTTSNNYSPPPNRIKKNELQLFLNKLALGHYYNNFINHGFGNELSGLTDINEQILINMGINIMAHRRTILKQLYGPDYFKQQQPIQPVIQQQQQQQQQPDIDLDDAFEKLLGGHGSIKQRLRSMDQIFSGLDYMNIETDNGKVLLSAFSEQILHEDYIYREYKVRMKAIETIPKIFIFCLNKLSFDQIPNLIDNSLPEILDSLFLLLDNNRAKQFHDICKQCINKIIESIVNKNNKQSIISLVGLLNEKINIENINQPHARFYASNLIFQNIIFKYDVQLINNIFNFDICRYDNKLIKYTNGIPQNQLIIPKNNLWFDLLTANQWNTNDDETFKDIITDTLSMMILDPNCDLGILGCNLTVYFNSFNQNFRNSLETEAKYRFKKFYPVQQSQTPMQPQSYGLKKVSQQPPNPPVQKQSTQQKIGEVDYRIKQLTAVNVAPPTLPSI